MATHILLTDACACAVATGRVLLLMMMILLVMLDCHEWSSACDGTAIFDNADGMQRLTRIAASVTVHGITIGATWTRSKNWRGGLPDSGSDHGRSGLRWPTRRDIVAALTLVRV